MKLKPIKEMATVEYGKSPKEILVLDSQFPVYGTGGRTGFASYPLFYSPVIVVGRKGTLGKPIFSNVDCWIIDTAYAINTYQDYDCKWLYYNLQNYNLEKLNEATGVPSLSRDYLYRVEFNTPPLPEQKKIAEVLTTIDNIIEKTEQLIEKLKNIKKGLMHDLFTRGVYENGQLRPPYEEAPHLYKESELGWIPKEWEVERLENVTRITTGNKDTVDNIPNGLYPFFVRSQKVERINTYSYDGEAFLTAGDGVGTGKVHHYINGKFDFHQRVYMMSNFNKNVSGKYLFYYFRKSFYYRVAQFSAKTTVDSVRYHMIAEMLFPKPKNKEQITIKKIINNFENKENKEQQALKKLKKLKQGLMEDLPTGKVRVTSLLKKGASK